MKIAELGKTFQMWLIGFDALMTWFLRHINAELYHQYILDIFAIHFNKHFLSLSRQRTCMGYRVTSSLTSKNGALCLNRRGKGILLSNKIEKHNIS